MMATPITYALWALSKFYPVQKPLLFSERGSVIKLADFILASGQNKILLVTDKFLLETGKLESLITHIRHSGGDLSIYDGTLPNPTMVQVAHGLAQSIENHCQAVLAVGGGSVIDVAKVIAAAQTNGHRIEKLAGLLKVKKPPLPFYVVPTTSGTGSEVTNAAVISDPVSHEKKFFIDPKYIPIAAALDSDLLKSLPAHMTAAVGMDALTHAIEAYTSRNNSVETDRDAAIAIKLLFQYLPKAYQEGDNLKAREMVSIASFLAGYAFTKSSLGYVHAISHQLSALYDTPHGLANAIILPRVLRFNRIACQHKYAELDSLLGGNQGNNISDRANGFIARVDDLSTGLSIPQKLDGLKEQHYRKISQKALSEAWRSYAVPKVMGRKQIEIILDSVRLGHLNMSFA